MIKTIIKIGVSSLFLGGVIFAAILQFLPDITNDIREVISYTPLEVRAGIYLIFGGLLVAFAKSFYK